MAKNPKPFLDVLFEEPEGFEMNVKIKHSLYRKGDVIVQRNKISAVHDRKYAGELVFEMPIVQKESRIVKPK